MKAPDYGQGQYEHDYIGENIWYACPDVETLFIDAFCARKCWVIIRFEG
jgi:hypothetical protein